ncbi:MAG TPA: protease pro-enzyme activation domain-containing protein [Terriglobales bacterium]|nr:protease pro-enzyme activation domain-containing protein [Terriglobales bacterium]
MHSHTLCRSRRSLCVFTVLALTGLLSLSAQAQRSINDADRVTLHGNTHPMARAEFDRGSAPAGMRMNNMILLLSVRPDAQLALQQLLSDQQDPSSASYHQWLTPAEFGARFGPTDQDIADATNWLKRFGFTIDQVGNGRMWINFSGNVQKVERAFQTNIRQYEVNGKMHHANASDPTIPRALTSLVQGVVSLNDFPKHRNSTVTQLPPDFTNSTDGSHFIAPGDFATIYNVTPLYSATPAIDGTGQTIAIVGRTDINLADVQFFRSFFGLPVHDPVFINNGADPGDLGGAEETEADLDVEWAGAIAKNATIDFVISQSTATTDGVDLSAQYIVNNNIAKVMSTSFGLCESSLGSAGNSFWGTLWAQAAAQGITSFVAAGDSGAAGCDAPNSVNGTVAAVSGLSSTPNNVAVGGTLFNDSTGNFWNATNNPDQSSAISYIPESVWNESANDGGSGLFATGGGTSSVYSRPSYQTGTGVPGGGQRLVPDVSLSAATHDAYIVVQGHTATFSGLEGVGGTSASSPSFASIMALVLQQTGAAQGNANTVFYSMARNQFAGGIGVYHDITLGDNSVPGVNGFKAGVGYDQSTGWGSPDVAQLVSLWNNNAGTPDFNMNVSSQSQTVGQNASTTFSFTIVPVNGFTGTVNFSVSGLPGGTTASFNPTSVVTSGTTTLTITTSGTTPLGSFPLTVTASSGKIGRTATVTLIVANPDFSLAATPSSQTVIQGNSASYSITQTAINKYAGTVSYSVSGLPAGASASFTPASIATSGTTTLSVSTAATTPGGSYALTITGTDGTRTHTASVTLVVSAVDFSLAATPPSQTVVQGSSTSYSVSLTPINGYAGTVNFSVSGLPAGATGAFTPTSLVGSGTTSLAVSTAATTPAGSYTLTITGTDGTLTHTATVTLVVNQPDFAIAATPASQSLQQGGSTSYTVTLSAINGYAGTVNFSVSGLPVGATATFTPASLVGSGTSTLAITTANPTTSGSYTLTITGSDGTLTHTASVSLVVSAPDFSLSSTPASQTINQGGTTSYSIAVNPISGYTGTVSFAVSALPAGASATFNPVSVLAGSSTSLNITSTPSVVPGSYPLTVTGSDGTLTHTVSITLVVTPAGDFILGASPASQTINSGENTGFGFTISSVNGFTGVVSLTVSGLPAGASGAFTPSSITGAGTANLAITTSVTLAAGVYNLTITGTSGAISHSVGVQLIVNPAVPGDFTVAAPDITVKRNKTGSETVTVSATNGFTGTVDLSVTGAPSGVTVTLAPTSIAGGSGSATLTFQVPNNAKQGAYPITITGTSGSLIHAAGITLTIN